MLIKRKTQQRKFWLGTFEITQNDIDYLYNLLLESEMPLTIDEMTLLLMRHRVRLEEKRIAKQIKKMEQLYRPADTYAVGDELMFLHLDRAVGTITAKREGANPLHGTFDVIAVEFEDGEHGEFVSAFEPAHPINNVQVEPSAEQDDRMTAEELFIEYGGDVAEQLEATLTAHDDLVKLASHWFPRSLMVEVNEGHLNLAEAVLFMYEGGPLPTSQMLQEIGILEGVSERLAEFSLNYAMSQDERFDEVGATGQVLWFLLQLEPEGVKEPPELLRYKRVPFAKSEIIDPMWAVVRDIGDEHSKIEIEEGLVPTTVTLTLNYPHWRSGTLPLSGHLLNMFPTAYESERIRFLIVDEESGEEYPAWVVRSEGYVYGLQPWISQYEVPVGAYLTIHRLDEDGIVRIDADTYKPRKEYVLTATVSEGSRLYFENTQRRIGVDFDELMIIDVQDPDTLDTFARTLERKGNSLVDVLWLLMNELAPLYPQGQVNAKTIYAAVNLLRRVPPEPIFALLGEDPRYEHVGGPYWRIRDTD